MIQKIEKGKERKKKNFENSTSLSKRLTLIHANDSNDLHIIFLSHVSLILFLMSIHSVQ